MLGIVLAGGESSRMPNKLLLPTYHRDDQRLVINSAIGLCQEVGCEQVRVVLRDEDDVVRLVLPKDEVNEVKTCREGVGKSVVAGCEHRVTSEHVLVTFGDNVYCALDEADTVRAAHLLAMGSMKPVASARHGVPSIAMHAGLDWWDDTLKCWQSRELHSDESYASHADYPFAGWVVATVSHLRAWEGVDTVTFLRKSGALPYFVKSNNWYDCGTKTGYETYLRRTRK